MCHDHVIMSFNTHIKIAILHYMFVRSRHYEAGMLNTMVEDKTSALGFLVKKALAVSAQHGRQEERGLLQPISLYINSNHYF